MRTTWHAFAMELGGPKLKEMRELAGFPGREGRERFAKLVGVERRTVEGWEASNGHVPDGKTELVKKVLEAGPGQTMSAMSNIELVSILADRLARYEEMERDYRELLRRLEDQESPTEGNDPGREESKESDPYNVKDETGNNVGVPRTGWGPLT